MDSILSLESEMSTVKMRLEEAEGSLAVLN